MPLRRHYLYFWKGKIRISKYILSPQEKPFVFHTRPPEPVLRHCFKMQHKDGKRVASMPHSWIQYFLEFIFNFDFTNDLYWLKNELWKKSSIEFLSNWNYGKYHRAILIKMSKTIFYCSVYATRCWNKPSFIYRLILTSLLQSI